MCWPGGIKLYCDKGQPQSPISIAAPNFSQKPTSSSSPIDSKWQGLGHNCHAQRTTTVQPTTIRAKGQKQRFDRVWMYLVNLWVIRI